MKKILLIILLLIASVLVLSGEEGNITFFHDIHLKEVMYNYELIQEYVFDKPLGQVYFTKPTLNDSGNLSLSVTQGAFPRTRLSFDENLNFKRVGIDSLSALISQHGEYFVQFKTDSLRMTCRIFNKSGELVGSFAKDNPPDFRLGDTRSQHTLNLTNINDNGIILYSESVNDKTILYKDMTSKKVGPFYNDESLKHLIHGEYSRMSALSKNVNFAVLASENHYLGPEKYFTFPLGSRVFFYDEKANFLKSYDIEGVDLFWPAIFSESGKYFIMCAKPYMYLFKDTELVLKKNVKGLGSIRFSEDESVVLVGTGIGNLIIDLKTCKTIKNIESLGSFRAIANKEFPIITCATDNEVYVVNYETEEVMLAEIIGPKYPTHYRINNLQISGDGKTITLFHHKWYRKYKIGGRK